MATNLKTKMKKRKALYQYKKRHKKGKKGQFRYLSVLIMIAVCGAMVYNIASYMNRNFGNYQIVDQLDDKYIKSLSEKECYADLLYYAMLYYSDTYQYNNMTREQAREKFYHCRDVYEQFLSEEKMAIYVGRVGEQSKKIMTTYYSGSTNAYVVQRAISVQLGIESLSPSSSEFATIMVDGKKSFFYIYYYSRDYSGLNNTKAIMYDKEKGNNIFLEGSDYLSDGLEFDYKNYFVIGYSSQDLYAGDKEVEAIYQKKYSNNAFNKGTYIKANGSNLRNYRVYLLKNVCGNNYSAAADVTNTSYYKEVYQHYKDCQKDLLIMYYILAGMMVFTALLFIYKQIRKNNHPGVKSNLSVLYLHVWSEIRFLIFAGLLLATIIMFQKGTSGELIFLIVASLFLIYTIPSLYMLYSLGRHFFDCSVLMTIHKQHCNMFFDEESILSRIVHQEGKKNMLFIVIMSMLLGIAITLCIVFQGENVRFIHYLQTLTVAVGYIWILAVYSFSDILRIFRKEMRKLEKQVIHLGEDDLNGEEIIETSELKLAKELGRIQDNLDQAICNRMLSERMKLDLVTNVSHDLKTPLTSIINYVDLLYDTEELPSEAKDYVKVLKNKSYRLKAMIQDLFDLSKATSGNLEVDIGKINFTKLVQQTMADMGDEIEKSGLMFRVFLIDDVMIYSDGNRMYRVLQNLFVNVIKYSMEMTRVYVHMKQTNDKIQLEIKNISKYELNFTEKQVKERFFRGDTSRSTAGSGLGVAIANSFTEVCGGSFDIRIDGDLFCARVKFPKIQEKEDQDI